METNRSFSRQRKPSPSSDRFLTLFSQSPSSTAAPSSAGDELSEDDVFWNGESSGSPSPLSSSSPSTSSTPLANRNHRFSSKSFGRGENFGILAALPEIGQERNNCRSIMPSTASALPSSSSSSSARTIPVIPRPPPERTLSASMKHHQYQSAPVNVPLMMRNDFDRRREGRVLEESVHLGEDDEEGEMLPPHEIVAKQAVKSPILSCSVLEGAGRTLKGRDLRRVRNAVFRQTGYLLMQLWSFVWSLHVKGSVSLIPGADCSIGCNLQVHCIIFHDVVGNVFDC